MEDREVLTVDAVTKVESFKKFPLWIIEYVWAHKTLDLQEGGLRFHFLLYDKYPEIGFFYWTI